MKLSELKPAQDLRDRLNANPAVETQAFTSQDIPSSGIPDEYISIQLNGAIRRVTSSGDLYEANLLVQINVRLKSTGAINQTKEDIILRQIEDAIAVPGYVQRMSTVYEGKNLVANYSTKMINLICRIRSADMPVYYDLSYYIPGATPEFVVRSYKKGTRVILETPEQLGMTLPDNYRFVGWQMDGQTVTEVVMDSDKTVQGEIDNRTHIWGECTPISGYSLHFYFQISGVATFRINWGDGTTTDVSTSQQGLVHTFTDNYHIIIERISGSGIFTMGFVDMPFIGGVLDPVERQTITKAIIGAYTQSNYGLWGTAIENLVIPTSAMMGRPPTGQNFRLTEVTFEEGITDLPAYTIQTCRALRRANTPSTLKTIGNFVLFEAMTLETITFESGLISIGGNVLTNVHALRWVEFKGSIPPSVTTYWLVGVSALFKIYVPDNAVDTYKTATNFVQFANRIYPASQKPTEE